MILLRPLPPVPAGGWVLHLLATRRLAAESVPRPKSLQYGNALMGRWEMVDRGLVAVGAEGLMLTPQGWLAEGLAANLFFLHQGRLCTPALELGVLPGVVREVVLELARAEGYPVHEGAFPAALLAEAELAFLTNAVCGLAPVRQVFDETGRLLAELASADHPLFRQLEERFLAGVGRSPPAGPGPGTASRTAR
jgi:4-amino-4-deoxychorismate lyase